MDIAKIPLITTKTNPSLQLSSGRCGLNQRPLYLGKQSFSSALSFKQNVKVSVILPIYNQEKFLPRALDSLVNQTLNDVEFICVNDGSKDKSLEIMDKYAQKDSRIKIINQKNQGCGCARNNGLKIAKGEYIAFLDPDDWLEKNALEELYKKSKKQNCDMLVFDFKRVNESGKTIGRFNLKKRLQRFYDINPNENFYWRDIKPKVLGGMYPVSWNKFFKRELIKNNKLHFAKCNLAEDNVFVFAATLKAKSIGYLDKCLYNYRIHKNSTLRSVSDKNLCFFKAIDSVKKMINNLGFAQELEKELDGYVLRFVSFHAHQVKSLSKLKDICLKKLTPRQNKLLLERLDANPKLFNILNSIIRHKKLR